MFSFCQRDIKHNTDFQWHKITSCWFIVIFNVFDKWSKKGYVKYDKYTDLPTYFLEKNILFSSPVFRGIAVPKFQVIRSALSNVIKCAYLTAICYRKIPAFYIL